jgi:F0F1-type ATP synthase assembly protein I
MAEDSPDGRSPIAQATAISSQIITIAAEMAVPALAGWWIDQQLGTKVVFLILGVALGFAAGIWHLVHLARQLSRENRRDE